MAGTCVSVCVCVCVCVCGGGGGHKQKDTLIPFQSTFPTSTEASAKCAKGDDTYSTLLTKFFN